MLPTLRKCRLQSCGDSLEWGKMWKINGFFFIQSEIWIRGLDQNIKILLKNENYYNGKFSALLTLYSFLLTKCWIWCWEIKKLLSQIWLISDYLYVSPRLFLRCFLIRLINLHHYESFANEICLHQIDGLFFFYSFIRFFLFFL